MNWNIVKIGKVLKQYRIEHWVQNDKVYQQVSILNDGSVILRGEKIGKEIGRKRQFIINLDKFPDTLIFTRQLLLQGSIGMASKEVNGCIVTENMPMFSVEGINPQFLFYFIKSELFKAQVRNLKTSGTAQKSLHERQFLDIEIPLPSSKEQKEIIARCKLYESNCEKIDNEIFIQQTHLQLLRQAILQEAVQGKLTKQNKDDEPADKLLQRIKAEKKKLIAAGKLKKEKELPPITEEEIPFELPKGWVWCRIDDICLKITDGEHLNPPTTTSGIPLLSAKHVGDYHLLWEDYKYVSTDFAKQSRNRCNPDKGDLLVVGRGGGVGRTIICDIDKEFCLMGSVILIKPVKIIDNIYLYYYLNSSDGNNKLKTSSSATAQPAIYLTHIKRNYLIPLAPISEQHRIVKKVQQLLQMVNQLEQQVTHSQTQAQQLLQAVLKEAFTNNGKVYEVNNVVTMAAEG